MGRDTALSLSRVHFPVTSLGPGVRVGIWVQGCTIGCAGCISRDTWDSSAGSIVAVGSLVDSIVELVGDQHLDGVTISGGEPFQQPDALSALIGELRAVVSPSADILVYSGHTLEALRRDHGQVLAAVDAVISDPYVGGRTADDGWRGSTNQRLTVMTPLGRRKEPQYRQSAGSLQVSVAGGRVWIVGIPQAGDMDRLVAGMNKRGVHVGQLSWRP